MDPVKVCPQKSLSTALACWNNVFDLAVQQQQVLGGLSWSYCSPPALICRPRTGLPFPVPFLPISSLSSFFCVIVPFSLIVSVFLTSLIATICSICLLFWLSPSLLLFYFDLFFLDFPFSHFSGFPSSDVFFLLLTFCKYLLCPAIYFLFSLYHTC